MAVVDPQAYGWTAFFRKAMECTQLILDDFLMNLSASELCLGSLFKSKARAGRRRVVGSTCFRKLDL
jgi:hypothetical protein